MARLLVVDDDPEIRVSLAEVLSYDGHTVEVARDGVEAQRLLERLDFDIVLCDVRMPGKDGMELLSWARQHKPETEFIMLSGHATIETAVAATKMGAFDFMEKPLDLPRLEILIRNASEKRKLVSENKTLVQKAFRVREILGISPAIQHIREMIDRVAPLDTRVLITGPSGSGKELVARWIHLKSQRSKGSFVDVNCAAIPPELIESELFGHEKGAFTHAIKQRIGRFEEAHGGTLFLDEIGDMALPAQAKVLRVIEEGKIRRVGGEKDISVNVRIIAATNKNLPQEIIAGRFRDDLYHRLSVVIIHVPPLRERREDIPILAEAFLREIIAEYNMPPKAFTPAALQELSRFDWHGNIRELRNAVERLAIFADKTITPADVRRYVNPSTSEGETIPQALFDTPEVESFLDQMEREYLLYHLRKHNFNISRTAEALNMQRTALHGRMKRLGIHRSDYA
ncbi:MAG: sigma-54 dependent transcriptional regulator [Bacteroidia bacterium]|nr:sigma-54 dependent transcriptional regulator [Bacteroidia bacterium]MCX7652567.1 sigma-54 dependent transcriptional regulator [Bacteroidia bacterium]MDW8417557.1 sigma-54 dependent transcriptional regulator [Bacteroidia bacterium]